MEVTTSNFLLSDSDIKENLLTAFMISTLHQSWSLHPQCALHGAWNAQVQNLAYIFVKT